MFTKARMPREGMLVELKVASSRRKKASGKMMKLSTPSEHSHKESTQIDETPSQHSVDSEGLRRRRQPVAATAEETTTITHHNLPKSPPFIHTDRGHKCARPLRKERKWRLPFSRLPFPTRKGFRSSRRKPQTPSTHTSTATSATDPFKKKEPPPDEVYANNPFETTPEDSSSEEYSILSGYDEIESVGSDYQGWERLERTLEIRDKTLKRVSKGRSEAFVEMLRNHEEAAKQQKRKEYGQELALQGPPGDFPTHNGDQSVAISQTLLTDNTGVLGEVRRLLLFEGCQSGEAVATIVISCAVGIAVYSLIDAGLREIGRLSAPYVNINQYHALLIVFGVIVMRLTGYFWWYLEGDSFACVKFELHNRQKLGYWDARLMNYLYRSSGRTAFARDCLNILGFYSLYIGLYHFYYMVADVGFWEPLIVWFERIEQEARSAPEASVSFLEEVSAEPDLSDETIEALVYYPIRRCVATRLCMTDDWNEFAIVFNVLIIVVGVAVCNMFGSSMMPLII
jgi:hypothetical protein